MRSGVCVCVCVEEEDLCYGHYKAYILWVDRSICDERTARKKVGEGRTFNGGWSLCDEKGKGNISKKLCGQREKEDEEKERGTV